MHNQESVPENETNKILWDFEIQTDHLISARRQNHVIVYKKKKAKTKREPAEKWNLALWDDHRIKLKEVEKRVKYQDIARELKKLWNMKVTVIPFVIGVLSTVTKRLIQGLKDLEIRGRLETINITTFLRSTRRVQGTWGGLLSLKL